MILILSKKSDPHSDLVIGMLEAKGAEYVRFNTDDFPLQAMVAIEMEGETRKTFLYIDGQQIDLDRITSVWCRRPGYPTVNREMEAEYQKFCYKESLHFLQSLWYLLRGRFWINPFDKSRAGEYKPYQLGIAQEVGFKIPRTLFGNNSDYARNFIESISGDAIYKPYTAYIKEQDNCPQAIYTNVVNKEDISRINSVKLAPCIFQEYVNKRIELRITIIGQRIFAAEIHSQNSFQSKIDWRRYDLPNTPYYPHDLPKSVREKCKALMQKMGLVFGCIDMIITPENEYIFLEINPTGQWYWIEQLTGMPLLENFTEMLIQSTPAYESEICI